MGWRVPVQLTVYCRCALGTLSAGQNLSITATGKNNAAQSGDIAISGSQLKAGKALTLDAARDIITLHSAQNSESTTGTNSSKGGSVGVGIGAGTGGYGISVSAGVNAGKGHENGSGLTHSETTLDAGSHLSLTSGRDTTLKGAQASGGKITVDAGRNLTLESERDSDRYNAKQQNASAGGSFTFGSAGSASVSASRDRLKSNFDSVKEQTGLFAGKGGYDVRVGEHTQLDGAVIASTADADSNRLDTGTLGWSDIHNQADYRATHSGGSLSTGGPVGRDLLTNMAGGMLSGANNSGHAEGTTKAGVSEGALLIRDKDRQQQDITTLNRDTDHANDGSISPIFNREKEQNRLRQAQLIGEIAGQAMDVIRTQGDIAGLKAQTDPAALAQAREQLKKDDKPFRESDVMQRAYNNAMQQYGTGSDLQKAAQAVTGALTALAGNNLAGALASGASPYLATEIKKLTTNPLTGKVDVTSNAMAHAVLGAVTAQLNNQSAVASGLGAGGGELAARVIAGQLFPGKTTDQLSESEKQQVSALSQLASGLAGGLATGDTGGAVTAAQAGKNAVENNALSGKDAQEKNSIELALSETGLALHPRTPEEVAALEERHDQLTKLDAEVDQYVQDACSQGRASPACQDANALAQGLQDSYNDYLGRLTYKELNREDYAQVSQIVANTSADKWDYAIEGYAKSQNISYQEAKDRFALAININQAADIAGIFYGLKGNEGGKTGISSAAASTLKQLMTKYDEFKQNIASSTKGNNDGLITATPGAGYAGSEGSEVSSSAHLSVGAGGKGNSTGKSSAIPVSEPIKVSNGLVYKSNPKHTLGQQGNRPNAGIEPKDSLSLFEHSIPSPKQYPNKEVRFAVDSQGNVHRFEGTNGQYHWNGSTGDKNALTSGQIPNAVQKQLGVRIK
nr:hemagglutinin repeat-containing protein [Erwinia aphidicola]